MGLHEQSTSNGLFLSVKHGAICLEHPKPYPETDEEFAQAKADGYAIVEGEVNGDKYKKAVKKFGRLDGRITKVEWYDRTHGNDTYRGLKIHVKDNGEAFQLDLPFEKRQYDYFTKVAENIDYSKPVEFNAWQDKMDHRVTAFGIKQDGKFIQWNYTKENPGECPPPVQAKTTGKWNFDNQREWLLERILTVVVPMVESASAFDEPQPEYTDEPKAIAVGSRSDPQAPMSGFNPSEANGDDDIPF